MRTLRAGQRIRSVRGYFGRISDTWHGENPNDCMVQFYWDHQIGTGKGGLTPAYVLSEAAFWNVGIRVIPSCH